MGIFGRFFFSPAGAQRRGEMPDLDKKRQGFDKKNLPASLVIGMVAGVLGFYCVSVLKQKLGYDDSLDAFGVHGMCGLWGALATGIFANPEINASAVGLLYGNPKQIVIQLISIIGTALFTAVGTLIVVYATRFLTGGLRVEQESEIEGLDSSLHGERAFEIQ